MPKPIKDIPDGSVGQVVQDFIDNGESVVLVSQQGNGGYTVIPSETQVAAALTKLSIKRQRRRPDDG